ncbi:MAG TPA: Gfo/Idh/MocA family oxidoreductase [Candidatus Binatia bacterium]|jgi:myo-inositol 2-dehydrogenase/D-chiro-inositol 1-dehydrogenase|nr:Gfo/Idh/MocA family oxidoreductase [Candidatus Binatia bacterium]
MTASQNTDQTKFSSPITRRRFLAGTSASVLAFTVIKPELVGGAAANSKIDLGLIGCGGRGKWIADLFRKHGGYNVVAVADYFQDRADGAGEQFKIEASNRYTGLSGYRKLLEQKLDAVAIESPPYFHPEHAAAAVEAGRHVYLAKPVAVDVPGCLTVEESGKKATAKKLCFQVDFQTRANKLYQDAARRVHEGELGKIVSVEANYQCGATWDSMDQLLRKDPKNPETRLRAWGVSRVLSGDIITEQNIHTLDVACWMLDAAPVRAEGTGGRARDFLGDCWDHFAVIFYFPNDLVVSFNSHQSGFGYDDIMCRVYGLKGTVDTHYFGNVMVKTTDYYNSGSVGSLYTDGVVTNVATFHDSITRGECGNPTVAQSVRSNLTTILGRMAAYKNGAVTWQEMMRGKEKLVADLKGLRE